MATFKTRACKIGNAFQAMHYFLDGLTDLADHDAFFDLFYDEDPRFEFKPLLRP
jgi:hypothetical protein